MAMKQMERGGNLDVFGTREYGQDVRTQNITAVSAVANIVKSSLGPVGLDKVSSTHTHTKKNKKLKSRRKGEGRERRRFKKERNVLKSFFRRDHLFSPPPLYSLYLSKHTHSLSLFCCCCAVL